MLDREPNQQDATLYLQLHALKDTPAQAEARRWWFMEFDASSYAQLEERYPRGTRERHLLQEFLGFYEGSGVLVKNGLLHEDIYFDAPFALGAVWVRMGPIIEEWQAAASDPMIWENVVWLGRRYEVWLQIRMAT